LTSAVHMSGLLTQSSISYSSGCQEYEINIAHLPARDARLTHA